MTTQQRITRSASGRTALAVAVAAVLASANAYAQQAASEGTLEEVVVTATKRALDVQDVPIAITALSGSQLDERGIMDVLSLDKAVPGLIIKNSGNDPQAIMRGAGAAGTTDVAVPYYVDNMYRPRLGQALASYVDVERVEVLRGPQGTLFGRNTLGGLINLITRKPDTEKLDFGAAITGGDYSLGRIEGFVNLPAGDVVALRATGAVEQRDPYVKNVGNPDAGLKDSDYKYGRAQLLWKATDTLNLILGGTYWKDTANGNSDYAYKCLGIPVNAVTQKFDSVSGFIDPRCGLRTGWDGGRSQAGNISNGDTAGAAIADPWTVSWDFKPIRDIKETSYSLHLDWTFWDHALVINAAKFDYTELRETDSDMSTHPALVAGQLTNTKSTQVDVNLTRVGAGALHYTLGYYLYDDSNTGDNNSAFLWGYTYTSPQKPAWASWLYQGNGGTKSTAVYGQADYDFTDKLTGTAGARYTKDKRNIYTLNVIQSTRSNELPSYGGTPTKVQNGEQSNTDWRLGLQYKVNDAVMVYGYGATGYIAGATQAVTNDLLDPNTVTTYELGVKSTLLGGKMRLNAALYDAKYDGLTTTTYVTQGSAGTIVSQQIPGGSIDAQGLEVDGSYVPMQGLRLDFGFAIDNSKFDRFTIVNSQLGNVGTDVPKPGGDGLFIMDGKRTRFAPRFAANVGVSYDIGLGGNAGTITPSAFLKYSDSYKAHNGPYFWSNQPAYVMLDIAAVWRSEDRRFSVRAYMNNVSNEAVLTEATVYSKGRAMADYTVPRNWGVRLGYNF